MMAVRQGLQKLWRLAAPPKALPDDDPAMLIGQARERVSAVPEGRQLVEFLDEYDYELGFQDYDCFPEERRPAASLNPVHKKLKFSKGLSADQMTVFLPHEAFHAVQGETVKRAFNFQRCLMIQHDDAEPYESAERDIPLLRPEDFIYARNLMEMAATGVQADIYRKMLDAGDAALVDADVGHLAVSYSIAFLQMVPPEK